MKKYLVSIGLSALLVLTACGEESNTEDETSGSSNEEVNENEVTTEENETEENEADVEEENEESSDDGFDTEVGESVENEAGEFTLHARQNEVEPIETGPVNMNITQVNAASGDIKPDYQDMFETEELNYIQLDIEVENTSEEDITFYSGQATISTNTGEQLESDMLLSDHIEGEMMAGTKDSGSFFYILENSNAEDVESVRMVWTAPQNEDWEEIGEEVDIEVKLDN
ncbi:hypothetical protein [Alteribacillus sp. YIM 98480]|uniref:hypothetical protein n=1 Tax=Alteribacillus sp. YIM 98480 TaxID=2606599 RepID=UPI00131E1A80|nr:hypothetical protein [Alteribacillus sp. YIM 98480]